MMYMPVYTSVCFEMIRKSFEWYTSGIRYSNPNLIPIFVDLGAGSGKTLLIANETKFFQICVGVELNENSSLQLSIDNLMDNRAEAFKFSANSPGWRPRNYLQWIPPRSVSLRYTYRY